MTTVKQKEQLPVQDHVHKRALHSRVCMRTLEHSSNLSPYNAIYKTQHKATESRDTHRTGLRDHGRCNRHVSTSLVRACESSTSISEIPNAQQHHNSGQDTNPQCKIMCSTQGTTTVMEFASTRWQVQTWHWLGGVRCASCARGTTRYQYSAFCRLKMDVMRNEEKLLKLLCADSTTVEQPQVDPYRV